MTSRKYSWGGDQEKCFEEMKNALIKAPILAFFEPQDETILKADSSNYGIGSVLTQIKQGIEKPVAYLSRTLSKTERNWTTTEKELLAIVWSIKKFDHFLNGKPFRIETDHHALCWLLNGKKKQVSQKLTRMALFLTQYEIEGIYHVKGKKHIIADCLSRFPVFGPDEDESDDEEEFIPVLQVVTESISISQGKDPELLKIINSLQSSLQSPFHKKYAIQNNVLFRKHVATKKNLIVIPNDWKTRILNESHDDPISAHLGFTKTYKKISQRYFWRGMKPEIREYIRSCSDCQTRKVPRQSKFGKMQYFKVPTEAFQHVQIDVMGPFIRTTKGNRYIVTAICYLTKWLECRPLKEATTEEIAKFIVEQIICRHGCPRILQSDRGSIFTSELFEEITKILGIKHNLSTSYHPESQGSVERSHSTLKDCISMYISSDQKDWDKHLHHISFAINTSVSESHSFSPFYLLYGHEAVLPAELSAMPESKHVSIDELISRMQSARLLAKSKIEQNQQSYAKYFNEKRQEKDFDIGSQVLVRKVYKKKGLSAKLFHHYYGPYTVIEKTSNNNYKVQAKSGKKFITETVHVEKLKPYYSRELHNNTTSTHRKDTLSRPTSPPSSINTSDTEQQQSHSHYNLRRRNKINYKI